MSAIHQHAAGSTFSHEALMYQGSSDLIARMVPFVREGLEREEPVMVALTPDKLDSLRAALNGECDQVEMVDMVALGRNPACIIPAWRRFLADRHRPGKAIRGIGEPIWSGRAADELVESQLHEALLNVAFAGADGFRLLCPYDVGSLSPAVIHEARCSHPVVSEDGAWETSRDYRGDDRVAGPFDGPLPNPSARPEVLSFESDGFADIRGLVARRATEAGLSRARASDLVLAVHELVTNSVRHGGGRGILRIWHEERTLVCEVRDRGHIGDRLAGRHNPDELGSGGRGLYIVNQLCDLVQLRSSSAGTVVRALMRGSAA